MGWFSRIHYQCSFWVLCSCLDIKPRLKQVNTTVIDVSTTLIEVRHGVTDINLQLDLLPDSKYIVNVRRAVWGHWSGLWSDRVWTSCCNAITGTKSFHFTYMHETGLVDNLVHSPIAVSHWHEHWVAYVNACIAFKTIYSRKLIFVKSDEKVEGRNYHCHNYLWYTNKLLIIRFSQVQVQLSEWCLSLWLVFVIVYIMSSLTHMMLFIYKTK